ncbi:MAG: tripartite tricarboxylate transporter substrate binding protein [Alphaproteobacteria bacterium]|nr:tripartite tricarboxylate transporter substrate binding protein [Alphaproteobacteria bacterium]
MIRTATTDECTGIARRRDWRASLAALALLACGAVAGGTPAAAQENWPDRPIRVIVPSSPGGPTDAATRLISARVLAELGQPLVIDNRAGGGGMIGLRLAARAAPDGYTLVMGNPGPVVVVRHTESDVGYDILTDFEPISLVMTVPISLVVRPEIPANTVADFVAYLRANPTAVTFGSSGQGQTPHMAAELLSKMIGVSFLISPYRGAPPAVNDLMAGTIQAMFDTTTALPMVRAGRLRALAIGSERRSALRPELPTMAELGYPGFEISSWYILLAPANTPRPIIEKLNGVVVRALNEPETRERLAAMNAEAIPSTPEQAGAYVRQQIASWGNIVRRIRSTN